MEYASLCHADIQSVSDQTDYRHNAKVSAACLTAVLPEQGAIWSYPKKGDSKDAFVMNMVSSMQKRIHLSGQVYGWTPEETELVKEAVRVYKEIREDIPKSIPFYPLGIPHYDSEFLCEACRTDNKARIALWRMVTDKESINIPLKGAKCAKILYPSAKNGDIIINNGVLSVKLDRPLTAMLIEILY